MFVHLHHAVTVKMKTFAHVFAVAVQQKTRPVALAFLLRGNVANKPRPIPPRHKQAKTNTSKVLTSQGQYLQGQGIWLRKPCSRLSPQALDIAFLVLCRDGPGISFFSKDHNYTHAHLRRVLRKGSRLQYSQRNSGISALFLRHMYTLLHLPASSFPRYVCFDFLWER